MQALNLIVISALLLLQACANPSIVNVNEKAIGSISANSIIFVPRFEGNPDFIEESTDYFVAQLESKISNTIIQGSVLRFESTDIKSGGNIAPLKVALEAAKENDADVLIMGKVTSHKTAGTLNGFSTIMVYNVQTGERLANFHRPSGMLIAHSEHQAVMAAVKRTASDVADAIK